MFCVLDIYKRNLRIIYKTTLCSKATFVVLVTTLVAVVLPFLFAYRSRGFWLKHDTFYEQPNVRFKGEYYFVGLTNNISDIIICNNIYNFPRLEKLDKCSTFKVREIDKNYDGKPDTLEFQMELMFSPTISQSNNLQHLTLIIPLDYKLQTTCPLKLQSAIIFQQTIPQKATQLTISGNLMLKQKAPLHCYPKLTDKLLKNVININSQETQFYNDNLADFNVDKIINSYLQRNFSTHLSEVYTSYDFKPSNFKLNLFVDYPEQAVYYHPGFWQILKWAWIQYLAIYIAFAWLIRKIQNYIFENDLVLAYKSLPTALMQRIAENRKHY